MSYGSIQGQNGYLDRYGDSMAGPLNMDNNPLTGLPAPTTSNDPVRVEDLNTSLSSTEWVELYNENFPNTRTGNQVARTEYIWNDWNKVLVFIHFLGGLGTVAFYGDNTYTYAYRLFSQDSIQSGGYGIIFPAGFNILHNNRQTLFGVFNNFYSDPSVTAGTPTITFWNSAGGSTYNKTIDLYYAITGVNVTTGNYDVIIYGERNKIIDI